MRRRSRGRHALRPAPPRALLRQLAQVSCAASAPPAPARADTRSAAHRARSGSAAASATLSASSCGGYSRASRARSRRWRSPFGYSRAPGLRRSARLRRIAVSASCSGRRPRTCMCTSPLATSGTPQLRARARQRREPRRGRAPSRSSSTAMRSARREALLQPVQPPRAAAAAAGSHRMKQSARACGLQIGARQGVLALRRRAPAAGDQAAQRA